MSVQNIIINRDEETYNIENDLFEENNLLIEEKKKKYIKKNLIKLKIALNTFLLYLELLVLVFF